LFFEAGARPFCAPSDPPGFELGDLRCAIDKAAHLLSDE